MNDNFLLKKYILMPFVYETSLQFHNNQLTYFLFNIKYVSI